LHRRAFPKPCGAQIARPIPLRSLIPADKAEKYSDRNSLSRGNSGFLKPAAARNSEKPRGITAKQQLTQQAQTANDWPVKISRGTHRLGLSQYNDILADFPAVQVHLHCFRRIHRRPREQLAARRIDCIHAALGFERGFANA
jgi:hypothetical protein